MGYISAVPISICGKYSTFPWSAIEENVNDSIVHVFNS